MTEAARIRLCNPVLVVTKDANEVSLTQSDGFAPASLVESVGLRDKRHGPYIATKYELAWGGELELCQVGDINLCSGWNYVLLYGVPLHRGLETVGDRAALLAHDSPMALDDLLDTGGRHGAV